MTTDESERQKYKAMWAQSLYRYTAPGVHGAVVFLARCPWKVGDNVVDLGCGTGRGGVILAAAGLKVTLIDFCPEAVEAEADDLIFVDANLWALPTLIPFDWIFCVDVLEHIPPEHVDATLDNFQALTVRGGYLQIATQPDGCGSLIGEKLHLTVENLGWWKQKIAQRWTIRENLSKPGSYANFVLGAPK